MSHFAKIENGVVTEVIVAEKEFIDSGVVGDPSSWIQTSYNSTMRNRYAGIGYVYDQELDIFLPPKPFPSWNLNKTLGVWEAPTPSPSPNGGYVWNEQTLSWEEAPNVLPGLGEI